MIHIVFNEADVTTLREAIALDAALEGTLLHIKDDYAVGPISRLDEAEGWQERQQWWKDLTSASPYGDLTGMVDDRLAVHGLRRQLEEGSEDVWIWTGGNGHDVCGYYWLIGQLKEWSGRICILNLNNLPFINEKGGIHYPAYLHQILPKEFSKARKLARKVTASEFELDPEEWSRLAAENAVVRVLEGGKKITGRPESFFDNDILQQLGGDWQKGSRIMPAILSRLKVKTGDVFLLWRMRRLQEEGKLELQGDPARGWKEFEVRRPGLAAAPPVEQPLEQTS